MNNSFCLRGAAFGLCLLSSAMPAAAQPIGVSAHSSGGVTTAHHWKHAAPTSTAPNAHLLNEASGLMPKTYSGTPIDVLTFHYDNNRSGWNDTEADLGKTAVTSPNFGLLQTLPVDGNVLGQPLVVSGFTMPDGTVHNILIVATGGSSIYAYDADTFATLWHDDFGYGQSYQDVNCDEVRPKYGISSTPVIVRTAANAATIYVVAATEPSYNVFVTQIHAVNLGTGADAVPPVDVAPTATLSDGTQLSFSGQNQWSRAGLAYNNGRVYVGISSHCDNDWYNISGWLLDYDSTTLKLQKAFHTINTPHNDVELASIWMSGFAPAIDGNGLVYVATGNGDYTGGGAKDWGQSVIALSSTLHGVVGRFTEATFATDNANDLDLGSSGIILLPPVAGQTAPPMALIVGKNGNMYLLNQHKLGGLRPNDKGVLQKISLNGTGLWGGPAYYSGPSGPTVFVQTDGDVLRSFKLSTGSAPSLTAGPTGTSAAGPGGSIPVVSSINGGNDGIVWLLRRSNPVALEAYDAEALGAPIYSANTEAWSNPDMNNAFVTPVVANGRVYAASGTSVYVFGLATPAATARSRH